MELVGDLERAFAGLIYPNRVVVAVVVLASVAALAAVAWRRGWGSVARRHPLGSVVVVAAALAVAVPLGWYLASPLVLSSTVDEPAPVVAVVPSASPLRPASSPVPATQTPGASAPSTPLATFAPSTSPAPPPPVERTGRFRGADDFHFGRGAARLIETAPGEFVVRLEDFAVRNGPDLFVYLSPDRRGYDEDALELGRLKADRGNQNYRVPAGTDVSGAASVVIWCRQFSVLFATAPLR